MEEDTTPTPITKEALLEQVIEAWFADGRESLRILVNMSVLKHKTQEKLEQQPGYLEALQKIEAGQVENIWIQKVISLAQLIISQILFHV